MQYAICINTSHINFNASITATRLFLCNPSMQQAENWNPPKVKATSQVFRMPHWRSVFHKCHKCAACSWHLISPCYSDPELEPLGLETAALPSRFHIQRSRSLTRLPQSEYYRSKIVSNLKGLQVNLHQSIAGETMR